MSAPWVIAAMRHARATEAAASVALSHDGSCACVACRATVGDRDAMAEILDLLEGVGGEDA